MYISPEDFGIKRGTMKDMVGGNKDKNARLTIQVLQGEKGPKRDVVLMNSAAAIMVSGKTPDLIASFEVARETIDSGKAFKKLEEIRWISNSL
jgi:anthranilate phosphoribosyltransferase